VQGDQKSETSIRLEERLTERFGILLSQKQLAELPDRTPGGLRYSLCHPPDYQTRRLRACGRRIGRRVYYPAAEVARIITAAISSD
jgi:hypothetical protein